MLEWLIPQVDSEFVSPSPDLHLVKEPRLELLLEKEDPLVQMVEAPRRSQVPEHCRYSSEQRDYCQVLEKADFLELPDSFFGSEQGKVEDRLQTQTAVLEAVVKSVVDESAAEEDEETAVVKRKVQAGAMDSRRMNLNWRRQ